MVGFCLVCECWTAEDACFVCGEPLVYGRRWPLPVGEHRYNPEAMSAPIRGVSVPVEPIERFV